MNLPEKDETTFEKALNELEKIVEKLEREDVELEKSLELFEKGVNLCVFCYSILNRAEGKIQLLTEKLNKEIKLEDIDFGSEIDQ